MDLTNELAVYKTLTDKNNLLFIKNLLEKVKGVETINKVEDPDMDNLLHIINSHNSYDYSTASLKNYVVRNIIETSNNPKNQIASYSPITMGEYTKIKESRENNTTLSLMDGLSMDVQQETNAVGKDVIGIAANGIKDYFAMVEYFSKYYKGEINKFDNQYFERTFNIDGLSTTVNRIAGLKLDDTALKVLNDYIGKQLSINLNPNSDPSLVLSSLLSAATDNAKELILKAINAGKEFASMHIYLITLGFNEGAVAKFMTSPDILGLLSEFKANIFVPGQDHKTPDAVLNNLTKDKLTDNIVEFKKIFNLSKELSFLARILKINQGLKASPENLYLYLKGIENEFLSREKQFSKENFDKVKEMYGLPKSAN